MKIISFLQRNWPSIAIVLVPSGLFLAPLPYSRTLYILLLIILSSLSFIKQQQVSVGGIAFLVACALSLVFGNAAPFFRSWERLFFFMLLLLAFFPVFQSNYLDDIRSRIFPLMIILLLITSIGSFIGYFCGINYMSKAFDAYTDTLSIDTAGWFGGLTYQSMTLSPICALSLTILVWIIIRGEITKKKRIIVFCAAFAVICCMMLTASRSGNVAGLAGTVLIVLLKYHKQIGKIFKIGMAVIIFALILRPVYSPYYDKLQAKQRSNIEAGSFFSSREKLWIHRIEEFSEYPVFGYGFCAIDPKNDGEYMASTGTIEPGSSWLAILSMTGVLGAIAFISLFFSTMIKLYRKFKRRADTWALLHIGILAVFAMHFIAEGYIFSAGGPLCFLFWFFFGCAYSYAKNPLIEYKLGI